MNSSFLFKALLFISLGLFSATPLWACVDLSGSWTCGIRKLSISQYQGTDGNVTYSFQVGSLTARHYLADNKTLGEEAIAHCDQDRLRLLNTVAAFDGERIVSEYSLSDDGDTLLIQMASTYSSKSDAGSLSEEELDYYQGSSCSRDS